MEKSQQGRKSIVVKGEINYRFGIGTYIGIKKREKPLCIQYCATTNDSFY